MILKVLNVLEYGSISPNRTLKMIVEFRNLKFLSIRSNVKRVANSALYKWLARLSQVIRALYQKDYANQVPCELFIFVDTQYPVFERTTFPFSACVLPGRENCISKKGCEFLNQSNIYLRGRKSFLHVQREEIER